MAKRKSAVSSFATSAAEVIGRTLGTVAGTVDRLKAEHPDPMTEAREVLADGKERWASFADDVSDRAAAMMKTTKAVVKKTRKAVAKPQRRVEKVVARAQKSATRAAKNVKSAVRRARKKTVGRRPAKRR